MVALLLAGCAGPTPSPSIDACLALDDASAQLACAQPLFEQAVAQGRAGALLDQLAGAQLNGTLVDCHMLAHHLGHAAFDVTQNLTQALLLGNARCVKGYYHGAIEAGLAQRAKRNESSIVGICDALIERPQPFDGCVHGLGHGLMWRDGDDVDQALADCGALPAGPQRGRCEDGVLMEASLRLILLPEAEYHAKAPYACTGWNLTQDQHLNCYGQIGEIAFMRYQHKLDRAVTVCALIDWDAVARAQCEQGARDEMAHANEGV